MLARIVQVKLALAVGEKRLMSPDVAKLFTEAGPGEVAIPDCTQLDAPLLAALLADCATPRHERP